MYIAERELQTPCKFENLGCNVPASLPAFAPAFQEDGLNGRVLEPGAAAFAGAAGHEATETKRLPASGALRPVGRSTVLRCPAPATDLKPSKHEICVKSLNWTSRRQSAFPFKGLPLMCLYWPQRRHFAQSMKFGLIGRRVLLPF
jgi:hypothetical protein